MASSSSSSSLAGNNNLMFDDDAPSSVDLMTELLRRMKYPHPPPPPPHHHHHPHPHHLQPDNNHKRFLLPGSPSSLMPSTVNQAFPPSGNMNNFDPHHLPEHFGGPAYYGMTYHNQVAHPTTSLELGVPATSNFYNAHLNAPSGARVFPVPLPVPLNNHGLTDQFPSSFSEHGRSNFSNDGIVGISKRKYAEGIQGNAMHFSSNAVPSSSASTPMTGCHFDSGAVPVDTPLALPEFRSNNTLQLMEVGSGVSAQHQSAAVGLHMDSPMVHNYNYLYQGNYGGQSFQPSSSTWLNQQAITNSVPFQWNGPPMHYYQGSSTYVGSSELGNVSSPCYSEASTSNDSANFPHLPMFQHHHNFHTSQNVRGARGYGVACYPPLVTPPSRVPASDNMEHDAPRVAAEPTGRLTGIRMYHPHERNGLLPDTSSRRRDLPRLRTLQADRVAILEFPNFYEVDYDVDSSIDHHRDMRLDIDDMSYEELLELSEQIGTVNTGMSEEDIVCHLKTRLYSSTAAPINLEELPCSGQNTDSCIICQDEYEDNNELGILDCGHEYHVECLKKWLLVKNVCPICKLSALTVKRKDR